MCACDVHNYNAQQHSADHLIFPLTLQSPQLRSRLLEGRGVQGRKVTIDALDIVWAQLTRDLFAIAEFLFKIA